MANEVTTIQSEYEKLRTGVPALKDATILRSPHFPHIYIGCVDMTVTFSIAEHENPDDLGPRIRGAFAEAQRLLDKSIERLAENRTGLR